MRMSIEVLLLFVLYAALSFFNRTFAHSAVLMFGIVIPWVIFLVTKTEIVFSKNSILQAIGFSFAFSGLVMYVIMILINSSLRPVYGTVSNSQIENIGIIAGNFFFLTAILEGKFFKKKVLLITSLTVALLLSFLVLIGLYSTYCWYCQHLISKQNLIFSVVILTAVNIALLAVNAKDIGTSMALLLGASFLSSSLSSVFSMSFESRLLFADLFRSLSLYFLLKVLLVSMTKGKIDEYKAALHSKSQDKERARELHVLRTNLTDILLEHDSTRLYSKILNHAIFLLHAEGGVLAKCDSKRTVIRIVASQNSPFQNDSLISTENSIIGTTISKQEPLFIQKNHSKEIENTGALNCISVPLSIDDFPIGALMVIESNLSNHFSKGDLELLLLFARQAAIALRNCQLIEDAQKKADTDSLTGLTNHRHFFELANNEFLRSIRYHHPLSALMFDIDHFKDVNDTYGHGLGDQVLISIANLCTQLFRSIDIVGRYGGEEFAVLLTETPLHTAKEVAERLRRSIAALVISHEGISISVTISTGIASLKLGCPSINVLISQADEALYSAKSAGRNKIVVWNDHIHNLFIRKQRSITYQRLKTHRRSTKNPHI